MITPAENKIVEEVLFDSLGEVRSFDGIGGLGEEALFLLIEEYDWDGVLYTPQELSQGMFIIPTVVSCHKNCDLATALTMFWLSSSFNWLDNDVDPEDNEIEWQTFSRNLIEKIVTGKYRVGKNGFCGINKYFSQVDVDIWKKRELPEVLFNSIGVVKC